MSCAPSSDTGTSSLTPRTGRPCCAARGRRSTSAAWPRVTPATRRAGSRGNTASTRATFPSAGNIMAMGAKPDGEPLKFGVRDPRGGGNDYIAVVTLSDTTMATSGDYERYFERDGVRYHHILDPATGRPGRHRADVRGRSSLPTGRLPTVCRPGCSSRAGLRPGEPQRARLRAGRHRPGAQRLRVQRPSGPVHPRRPGGSYHFEVPS